MSTGEIQGKPVSFGVIGYGAWGGCHARAVEAVDGAVLGGICGRSEESCARAKQDFPELAVFNHWETFLAESEVEAVVVAVPSHLHHQVAHAALEAGKHVLLEKPMALTLEDCLSLTRLAAKQNVRLAVGHELRVSTLWGRVQSLIQEGYLGDPHYVLVELSRRPYRQGADGWRYDIDRVGDWILEEPIHFFDLARWYLSSQGAPTKIYATANSRQKGHPELQDNFSAMVHFEGGAYAVVTQTLAAFEHHQTAKIAGSEGALWASWSGAMDRTRHPTFSLRGCRGEKVESFDIVGTPGEVFELEAQVGALVGAIREGRPLPTTGWDGAWAVELCLAANRSIRSGTLETLNPIELS